YVEAYCLINRLDFLGLLKARKPEAIERIGLILGEEGGDEEPGAAGGGATGAAGAGPGAGGPAGP
ncbi:MAG: hypothetical protein ACRD0J_00630, partial [Acidimicrobiales bacterium]